MYWTDHSQAAIVAAAADSVCDSSWQLWQHCLVVNGASARSSNAGSGSGSGSDTCRPNPGQSRPTCGRCSWGCCFTAVRASHSCPTAELSELPGSRALRAAGQQERQLEMHPLWQAEAHPQTAAVMVVSCSNLGAAGVVRQFAVSTQLGKCSRSGPSQAGYGASTYERL